MAQKQLTMANIPELDNGKAAAAFNHGLRTIMADIADRPADKAKRKVTFTIEAVPKLDKDTAVLDGVEVQCIVKTAVPVRQTRFYPMLLDGNHVAKFQTESPDDPRQAGLPFRPAEVVANGGDDDGDEDEDEDEAETETI